MDRVSMARSASDFTNQPPLPRGWGISELGNLTDRSEYGTSVKCDYNGVGMPVLRIPNIVKGEIDIADLKRATVTSPLKNGNELQVGDMLVCRTNGSISLIGKTAVVRSSFSEPCGFASYLLRFRLLDKTSLPNWVHFYIGSKGRAFVERNAASSAGQHNISLSTLHRMPIPVAPLNEQKRIIAKIEELFSELDAGVAALERVRANLKRYRAAVLKAAVEGKLTADWRAQHPDTEPASALLERILTERRQKWEDKQLAKFASVGKQPPSGWREKYPNPATPEINPSNQLPEGWCWGSLSQLGELDRGRSRHRPRNAPHLYGGPYPFIQTGDIRHARTFVRDYSQTYNVAGLNQSRLWPAGTLCITIAANIAETAILGFDACFPDSVVGFHADASCISIRYIEIYMQTVQSRLESIAPATAQKNLNREVLTSLPVILPPIAEQQAIVSEVDRHLSVVDKIEIQTEVNLKQAARLRQGILKRAFEGRLVPQDPSDEPAEQLLARIREQRQTASPSKNGSPRTLKQARTRKGKPALPLFTEDDGDNQGGTS